MLPRDLISTTHQPDPAPTGPPLRQDTSDGRMSSWKRGKRRRRRFSEQSIPGGLYVTIGTLGRLACRGGRSSARTGGPGADGCGPCGGHLPGIDRDDQSSWSVRGSAGLTTPSSPSLHEAIVQAIDAITAGLRVLLRACRSTTLPFRSPDHARGRYDTTIVPCAAGSDVVEVSGPDVAGTGVPRVAGR
jgi:hypothetical protein